MGSSGLVVICGQAFQGVEPVRGELLQRRAVRLIPVNPQPVQRVCGGFAGWRVMRQPKTKPLIPVLRQVVRYQEIPIDLPNDGESPIPLRLVEMPEELVDVRLRTGFGELDRDALRHIPQGHVDLLQGIRVRVRRQQDAVRGAHFRAKDDPAFGAETIQRGGQDLV